MSFIDFYQLIETLDVSKDENKEKGNKKQAPNQSE